MLILFLILVGLTCYSCCVVSHKCSEWEDEHGQE